MIEVGEYVRTPYCKIEKVERIDKADNEEFADIVITDKSAYAIQWLLNRDVKHSKNIIDLIEKGDYVNGMEIDEFDDVEGNLYLGFPIYDDGLMNSISEFRPLDTVEIKTIVTKEQFASMEYKVKGE